MDEQDKQRELDWSLFPTYFENVPKLDELSIETLLDVLKKYKDAGGRDIMVKHMHYGTVAKIKNFVVKPNGSIDHVTVWKDSGGWGAWEIEKCKLVNRPKERRRKKNKQPITVNNGIKKQPVSTTGAISKPKACDEHPNYTGKRKPRTGCKKCMAFYEGNKKPEKPVTRKKTTSKKKTATKKKPGRPKKTK